MAALSLIIMIVPAILIKGLVISKMWSWFIVPMGLTNITVAHAIGLSALISMAVNQYNASEKHEMEKDKLAVIGQFIGSQIIAPFFVLLIGYIVKLFM